MSATDKKKLRKEMETAFLTEKQKAEQAEAKKLRIYTIAFVSAMLLVVVIALGVLGVRAVNNSGIIQKNTIAATVGENKINSVDFGYYYIDAINEYYNNIYTQFSDYAESYLETLGLDTTKPLDEQVQDAETGKTWAEYFLDSALETAKLDYTMYNLAVKDGFELPQEDRDSLEHIEHNLESYATLYGYNNTSQYLRAIYGYGSDAKSYTEYCERGAIADAYVTAHNENLTYSESDIQTYEDGKEGNYNSYNYHYAYLSYTDFREGGTEGEEGNITYSDEENNVARAALKAAAENMATATSLEELKQLAEATEVNESSEVVVNEQKDTLYTEINATLGKWLADESRKEGDIAAIPNESTSTDEDGNETTVTNGYYVALYGSKSDNTDKMGDVRHLLVEFEGGTENEESGEMEYTDDEKAAAKTEAEGYLKTWNDGEKTEEAFIALVKEHSDDTSAEDGGLFENIHKNSEYVTNFRDWAIDASRKPGDCEVIETEFGYHVMYYVGDSEMNYRNYMISEDMRAEDHEKWYNDIVDTIEGALGNTSKINLSVTLG
ncbi:MAG: peptidylprolyl isomerase [Oscillospiraceae bacterium]|nr:peptidylprolyl isomerase [Oscillospiraceae bacterium]